MAHQFLNLGVGEQAADIASLDGLHGLCIIQNALDEGIFLE